MNDDRANAAVPAVRRGGSDGGLDFLSGGGEMGAHMRALDWRSTPLGDPRGWPSSLRTTVGILLNSRYPMFLAWGRELAFLYNDGYRPIFGEKHPTALGQPFARIWSEIWHDIGPLVERALAGEPTWSENLQLFMERRGFPEECYFTFSYSPVRGDEGAVEGMFCACTETTSEVVGERRLKTLRDLAAATGEARDVADVCQVAAEVFGANREDIPFSLIYLREGDSSEARLMGWSGCPADAPFCHPVVDVSEHTSGWPQAPALPSNGGMLRDLEASPALPGGPWPEPCATVAVLPLASTGRGDLRGYVVVGVSPRLRFDEQYAQFFDLLAGGLAGALANAEARESERKRAESLAELDRAKTSFFSNVSHEFRTPLTLILTPLAEALEEDSGLPAPLREPLAVAHRSSLRLLKLVNSLLDFSRIEAGRMRASFAPVDLAALTADLASNFRSACEKAGLELTVHCPALAEPVYVDRDMWEKIVLNLLSNAFKFTLEGSIEVALETAEDQVVLRVRDTGVGIPAAELPRLFERFQRVEGSRGRTHEGTGIGLALVRELVKLHGGGIDVHSEPGRGTTFSVAVPLGWRHLPEDQVADEHPVSAPVAAGAAAYVEEALRWLPDEPDTDSHVPTPFYQRSGERYRVLIADDNADMRGYLVRLLSAHWQVESVVDGVQALESARRHPPDLVVADVMMPRLDGFGLVRALRADESTAGVRVVMLSARAGEEARIEGLEAGVDDYLVKPFNSRELVARVSSQLALAQSARERAELLDRERAAQQAAELQKQHLRSLFMQAPAPVVILRGRNHVVELANDHACRVWGRNQEEVIDRPLLDALPELRDQVFDDLLDAVYDSGDAHVGKETRARLDWEGDGTLRDVYFNFVYAPMLDIQGDVDGVLVLAFDVTDQVHARERTDELRRQAEDASRAKDEFLAMLGHELRNPLAPILTALELMRLRGGDAFETERDLIERQARQLVSLVDDLLDVSRIAQGKVEIKREPVEISRVVTHAVEMVSPLLEQRRHHLVIEVPDRGLMVRGDAARLAQVISNLLSNAAKYTDPGGRITVVGERSGDQVVVAVSDNGAGITSELLPRIFDLFAQQPQEMDRAVGGLGLGLTIVRSIVELHGGRVEVRSEGMGRGSEFLVRFPALLGAGAREAASANPHGPQRTVARPVRILVVDDNQDAASVLAEYLETTGHSVRVAHDGPAALAIAGTFAPEAALLDIGLPGMDGYELASRLRGQQEPAPLQLIAITGYGQRSEREKAEAAGFDAHLVKPVDLDTLSSLLAGIGGID